MALRTRFLAGFRSRNASVSALLSILVVSTPARAGDTDIQVTPRLPTAVARARSMLARVSPAAGSAELVVRDQFDLPSGTITRFEQRYRGYRVVSRGAAVRENSALGRSIVGVSVAPADQFSREHFAPIARAAALQAARAPQGAQAELVWWSMAGGLSLTWELLSPLSFENGKAVSYRTYVDAASGEVRWRENRVKFMDQASVYPANPVTTKSTELLPLSIPSRDGILQNDFIKAYNCVDKKSKKPVSFGQFTLDLHVCDVAPTAEADANGDFVYTPVDDKSDASKKDSFAEVSIYFHAARAYGFFRELDGRPEAQVVASKPFSAVANLQIPAGVFEGDFAKAADVNIPLEPYSNAFFSPGGPGDPFGSVFGIGQGTMWFGQGPERDYAYDADVVYHEFTHAVVDHTLRLGSYKLDAQGLSAAPGGMNEGLADFFSSAITGDPDVGEYASKDMTQSEGVIRTIANDDTCPSKVMGEVHADSTLFSGALWAARASLPQESRRAFDRSLYESMVGSPGNGDIGYDELAKLFVKGLQVDLPAGATALTTAMTARGVLPKCNRVQAYEGKPLGEAGGFYAVGRESVNLGIVPGVMSFSTKLSERTARKFQVKYTGRSLGSQQGTASATPFTPVVLVKYDGDISWKYGGKNATPDADAQQEGLAAGSSLTFEIPDEVKTVSVQIGNSGASDGLYGQVELVEVLPVAVKPPAATPTVPAQTNKAAESDGGCATTGATPVNASYFATMLGGLALLLAARRRRSP